MRAETAEKYQVEVERIVKRLLRVEKSMADRCGIATWEVRKSLAKAGRALDDAYAGLEYLRKARSPTKEGGEGHG